MDDCAVYRDTQSRDKSGKTFSPLAKPQKHKCNDEISCFVLRSDAKGIAKCRG